MRNLLIVLILSSFIPLKAQIDLCYEEIAFDYFKSVIIKDNYSSKVKFYFQSKALGQVSASLYTVCFQEYYINYNNQSDEEKQKIKDYISNYRNISLNCIFDNSSMEDYVSESKKISRNIKYITINKANMYVNDFVFVEIIVFNQHSENHFFIEIDNKTLKVIKYCEKVIAY